MRDPMTWPELKFAGQSMLLPDAQVRRDLADVTGAEAHP